MRLELIPDKHICIFPFDILVDVNIFGDPWEYDGLWEAIGFVDKDCGETWYLITILTRDSVRYMWE